jgi:glutamate synthase domain-containing protein 3
VAESSSPWPRAASSFVKVMPRDYKRALRAAADAVAAATASQGALEQVTHG